MGREMKFAAAYTANAIAMGVLSLGGLAVGAHVLYVIATAFVAGICAGLAIHSGYVDRP